MEIKLGSKVKIAGINTMIVSDEEAEKAEFVVCILAGQEEEIFKKDNISTKCADCGVDIVHRPSAPKTPPKICMECAVLRMKYAQAEEDGGSN